MPKKLPPVRGRYRVTEMPDFEEEYIDEETKAFIRFDPDGTGEFHFGYVHGYMDCRSIERDGKAAVEWTRDGNAEHHPAMGRGWAVLQDDGALMGRMFFHDGDDYAFLAENWPSRKVKKTVKAVFRGRKLKRLK